MINSRKLYKPKSTVLGTKEVVVTYTTVTEGYDWGPAISKVVLDFGQTIDGKSLSTDTFSVISVRRYQGFMDEEPRTVIAVYKSDDKGNNDSEGSFVTIEMEVGPEVIAGSPFYYDTKVQRNKYVDTSYKISLADEATLKGADDSELLMAETTKKDKKGNINVILDDFDNNISFSHSDINLLYASYNPENASSEVASNPLIIWLHGQGEGGTDTRITLYGNKVVNLATDAIQSLFADTGAYILAPQSPTMWMDIEGTGIYNSSGTSIYSSSGTGIYSNFVEYSKGKSYYTESLMALIEAYVTEHPEIDPNRIYIGGCSNGGYMTIQMITTYPDYFAAAFPICEAYDVSWITAEKVQAIKMLPIWFTHALTDTVISIVEGTDDNGDVIFADNFTNALYNRLIEAGAENVHYSLFDNVVDSSGLYFQEDGVAPYEYDGHWSWIYTLNNECVKNHCGHDVTIFEWLAAQSK